MKKVFLILAAILLALSGVAYGDFYTQVRPFDISTLADGYNSGVTGESGASVFVVDMTKFRQYQGDVMIQLSGISTDGTKPADPTTGISVYYASSLDRDAASSSDDAWTRADWKLLVWDHLINTGPTGYPIAIPSSVTMSATPYLGIKIFQDSGRENGTGGSPFAIDLRGAVH
jgi:hypothetical protein